MKLIDTHCHLDLFKPDEVPTILARADESGVGKIISVAINIESAITALEYADRYDHVFATVGIHPHEALRTDAIAMDRLKDLGRAPKAIAVGETGLDYYRMRAPKAAQIEAFERQIELAQVLDLPLIIHCRDAYEDLIAILKRTRPAKAIIHCFSGSQEDADVLLDLDCHISLAGTVTFSNATALQKIAGQLSMDRLLIETDSPYLAPVPHRGRENEPAYIKLTAAKIAAIKGLPVEEVVKATALNADRVFSLST